METEEKTLTGEGAGEPGSDGSENTGIGNPEAEATAQAETNEADFTDTDSDGGTSDDAGAAPQQETTGRVTQTREKNAEFARRRREQEQTAALEKARNEAIIEALGGVNPYTNEEMKDARDVEEWRRMQRIEKAGGDPIRDYRRIAKEESAKAEKEAQAERDRAEWFAKDRAAFEAEHADIDVDQMIDDPNFRKFARGKFGPGKQTLGEIYAEYNDLLGSLQDAANKKAAQAVATGKATPGALSTPGETKTYFTQAEVQKMSREELDRNWNAVQESRKKW